MKLYKYGSIPCDAHAGDVKYHANSMVVNVYKVLSQNQTENITDKQLIKLYAAEEELVSKIEYGIHTGSVYEMKVIYTSYIESLKENNIEEIRSKKYLKMHLKDLLSKEIDSIMFENSVQRIKSAKLYSSTYSKKSSMLQYPNH